MVVMASVEHEHVALALGIWGTFLSIAVAYGSVAAAVWTNALPPNLETALPADSMNLTMELLSSLGKIRECPLGSPIRDAVARVYRVAPEDLVFLSVVFVGMAFACIFAWKNIDLRRSNDVQGARAKGVIW